MNTTDFVNNLFKAFCNSIPPSKVYCPRCKISCEDKETCILKYRGSFQINLGDDWSRLKDVSIDGRYDQLKDYLITNGFLGDVYHLSYVACDLCIRPEHKTVFAFFPDGWLKKYIKVEIFGPYPESVNIDNLISETDSTFNACERFYGI
jgi:hypothetical protein